MPRAAGSWRRSPGRWGAVRPARSGPARVGVPVAEAEERLAITRTLKTSVADERPVRRWEPGRAGQA